MARLERLRKKLTPASTILSAIGEIHRLSIMYLLAQGELDILEIKIHTGLAPSLLSHHLKVLEQAGWITRSKRGKRVACKVKTERLSILHDIFADTPEFRERKTKLWDIRKKSWVESEE